MAKPQAAPETSEAPPKSAWLGRLKIGGFILAIVVAEWVVASIYLPGGTTAVASADSGEGVKGESAEPEAAHGGHEHGAKPVSHGEQQEVDLGEYTVTGYQPVSSSTMFITFHLYATVQHKNREEFAKRLEENKHRIRDNVIVIIRSAEITDLTDAGLGLIKRRILETTNKTLGKPLLQAVVFSEFSFVEQ